MNYTQLSASIQSYIENTFPQTYLYDGGTVSSQTQIDTFIKQAEQRIYNVAQPPALRKNVNGTFTSGNKYLNLPPDFLSVYSVAVYTDTALALNSPQEFLLDKDVNFIRQAYPTPTDTGLPKYYALFGVTQGVNVTTPYKDYTLIVGPTPDSDYLVELHYFHYPPSIVDVQTSWLGDNFDSVLLYGSLLEAITFIKGEPDVVALYQSRYSEAMSLYKLLCDGKERTDAYRTGQTRISANT
jgi:hypothetical protein